MPAERDEGLYLADMRDAVDKILRYTWAAVRRSLPTHDPGRRHQNLEVMGEAVRWSGVCGRPEAQQPPRRGSAGHECRACPCKRRAARDALELHGVIIALGPLQGR